MDDLIDLLLGFFALKYIARLLRSGSTKEAGEQLDRDLGEIPKACGSCCGIYLVLMLFVVVLGLVIDLIRAGWHLIWH